jgi:hypothetical protein
MYCTMFIIQNLILRRMLIDCLRVLITSGKYTDPQPQAAGVPQTSGGA